MFQSLGDNTEVDNFLQNARNSLKREAYKKSRQYGFDFILDRACDPAQRFAWVEEDDLQLKLSTTSFAKKRLDELKRRQERTSLALSASIRQAMSDDLKSFMHQNPSKKLCLSSDERRSVARSSLSTLATLTSDDRLSTCSFDFDSEEVFPDLDVDN